MTSVSVSTPSSDLTAAFEIRLNELTSLVTTMAQNLQALMTSQALITSQMPQSSSSLPSSGQVHIPLPPATAPQHKSSATCKPPKEPQLTGDKAQEWNDFEREFLRYFRITQSYYLEPEVQVDLLLATAGEKIRKIFYQLRLSDAESKDLGTVIQALRSTFAQQQCPFVNSYLFLKIKRERGEDLDDFVLRLKEAAKKCAFQDEDKRVLEQLVFSTIGNVDVLKRVIKEQPPTLSEMVAILKTDEVAITEMERMVSGSSAINAIKSSQPPRYSNRNDNTRTSTGKSPRYQRGGKCANCVFDHPSNAICPAKAMKCHHCGMNGHMIAKCRKRLAEEQKQLAKPSKKSVAELECASDDNYEQEEEEQVIYTVCVDNVDNEKNDAWTTPIKIAGSAVSCKIDTGAEVNVMPERVYNKLRIKPRLTATNVVLQTVNGRTKPIGKINAAVQFKDKRTSADFFIMPTSSPTLCGLQTSVALGLVAKLFH